MNDFDWIFYTKYYTDINGAGITTDEKAYEHYKIHGNYENRRTHIDVDKYLKSNDVKSVLSETTSNFIGMNPFFLDYLLKDSKIIDNHKVLEIGCSIACLSLPIIKYLKNGQYIGVDCDRKCIEWARTHIGSCCNALFRCVRENDKFQLPFDNEEFDLIYSTTTFTTLSSSYLSRYLSEINRVLRKGGLLIINIFISNNSILAQLSARKNKVKLIIKNDNKVSIVSHYNEHVIIQDDSFIGKCANKNNFTLKEIIFGNWNELSLSDNIGDIICFVKN